MRVTTTGDLGRYVRERRHELHKTQRQLADEANVSLRWLANLEAGKASAEIGMIMRTLHALGLAMAVRPVKPAPDEVDLDALLDSLKE
ncbi:y4mF family transcriptional regulator [Hamadaea flava]|uniref:Helix-turn-helix domain-containing protein n=1 Tax=Hamadaea flava TaxID=1742688 RepID=A0ABV8LKZ7_9ACTN|nr:helix-turn-helix domain-containing protein [Hamadaea flava]MCP2324875.1 y4mF family transcriptional regulator [Hamadaea flava]